MSYILDALKKADREREQGQVPGLNAQPSHDAPDDAPPAVGLSPLVWAGVGVALTLAGVLAWRAWPDQAPADAQVLAASRDGATLSGAQRGDASGPAILAPSGSPGSPGGLGSPGTLPPLPSPGMARPSADRAPAPSAADGVPMQVDGAPVSRSAQPVLSVAGPGSPRGAARAGERATDRSADRPADMAGQPPNAPADDGRQPLPKLSDLPESLRKELPPLHTGGAMHSPNRAQRMLVLNGQVFHEGDSPEPGLRLEEIRLKSAVMSFKGQRFEVQY